jgi:hypothetical protein
MTHSELYRPRPGDGAYTAGLTEDAPTGLRWPSALRGLARWTAWADERTIERSAYRAYDAYGTLRQEGYRIRETTTNTVLCVLALMAALPLLALFLAVEMGRMLVRIACALLALAISAGAIAVTADLLGWRVALALMTALLLWLTLRVLGE